MSYRLRFNIILLLFGIPLFGQFYNGHQMQFGKNRVQYNNFYWMYFRFDEFDTYFNESGRPLAKYTAEFANKEIKRLENLFDYNLENRLIFIIYNNLSEFRQSNIGLVTGKSESNIGGTVQIDKNKVFLFFEGDYKKFEAQITAAITQVLINDMIYGSGFRDNITNTTLINLPDWFFDGLISYVSAGVDFNYENRIKDGILSGKYKKFNRLEGEDAMYAGHSFWRYIVENYGASVVPSIINLTKINKNANSGFYYVLGSPLKQLAREWYAYYYDMYSAQESATEQITEKPILKRTKRKTVYQQLKISPSGMYTAYVTNQMGKYKLFIYNNETGKKKKILRREHKLEQITDYSYPVLAWHPKANTLTFIAEEQGGIKMYYYSPSDNQLSSRNILYFEKILSYSFSPDGSLIVISGVRNGQSDIYVHNIAAGTNFQVTNDLANDFSPRFINEGTEIIFASDREIDSINANMSNNLTGFTQDLFIYDYANRSPKLKRLADFQYVNKDRPFEIAENQFISLSDQSGIVNRYFSSFDSIVSSVDTTVHYRYYATTIPVTNYSRNIQEQDYNKNARKLGEIIFRKGRYNMYLHDFQPENLDKTTPYTTPLRNLVTRSLTKRDSISKIQVTTVSLDSLLNSGIIVGYDTFTVAEQAIDINNYVFEVERIKMLNEEFKEKNINVTVVEKEKTEEPRAKIYQKVFYQNYVVSQIDFSFLHESYQPFTGNAVYFNPGFNLMFKLGTQDLFEDYKITAGLRLPIDFQSSEYLITVENLKKRLNKQLVLHRQTIDNVATEEDLYYDVKNITHEISGVLRYPFSQVTSVVGTLGFRNDKTIFYPLSVNSSGSLISAIDKRNVEKLWTTAKLEYIFDNTRSLGLNLPAGSRFKIFTEAYQQMNTNYRNLVVIGGDFRHYFVLHRNLIWANRFAISGSTGSSKLIYYLGGVDNWTNFSSRTPTFIPLNEIRLTPGESYAYQTLATNMRGFSQNIRNGSNFAMINSELRWPIVRYLANYPLSNAFLENFQVIGFFDIGSAWTGLSPWSDKNGYDRDYIYRGSVEVEIDAQRDPFVAGYGFGVRSQLFGYFIRLDWAWGIENMIILPRVFYFSLALDF